MWRKSVAVLVLVQVAVGAARAQDRVERIAETLQETAAAAARSVVESLPPVESSRCVALDVVIGRVRFDPDGKLSIPGKEAEPQRVGMMGAALAAKLNEEKENLSPRLAPGTAAVNLILDGLAGTDRVEGLDRLQLVLNADGKEARLQIGQRKPHVVGVQSSGRGTTKSVDYENLGTLLVASATIVQGGEINLRITFERSAFGPEEEGTVVAESESAVVRSPRIDIVTAETQLRIGDGESIVVGELVCQESNKVTETFIVATATLLAP